MIDELFIIAVFLFGFVSGSMWEMRKKAKALIGDLEKMIQRLEDER